MPRLKILRIVKVLSVNIILVALGILFLEIIFGSWFNPNTLYRLNLTRDSFLYDASDLYPTSEMVVYKRDKYGLRGEYDSLSSIDILTLGGSTTDQRYITEGETWQDILSKNFRSEGKSVYVVNAGVDGQSTYGHIKDFEWWFPNIPELKVKYFLFYVGLNDYYTSIEYDSALKVDDLTLERSPFKASIKEKSALYYLYRTLRGIYRANIVYQLGHYYVDPKGYKWTDMPRLQDHKTLMEKPLLAYEKRLRILGEKVRSYNAIPIFVTSLSRRYKKDESRTIGVENTRQFLDKEINGVDSYYMMRLINLKTLEVCSQLDGICIDLGSELQFEDEDFYDFYHTTPKGSEKIGNYLYQKLNEAVNN